MMKFWKGKAEAEKEWSICCGIFNALLLRYSTIYPLYGDPSPYPHLQRSIKQSFNPVFLCFLLRSKESA